MYLICNVIISFNLIQIFKKWFTTPYDIWKTLLSMIAVYCGNSKHHVKIS